ncbi:hypothetical protein [Salinibacter grassmerensis]|uniref:hypothetical protein n=1 Tax=Salinibacter grassmerensis TaxID=3040353 RepID=UPI0021E921CD|nr:hypothetical protein [Salinibacter grassmerensis]
MNIPTENDFSFANPNGGDSSEGDSGEGDPDGGSGNEDYVGGREATGSGDNEVALGPDGPAAERQVTPEEWRRLRAPFSRKAYVVGSRATGRTAANLPLEAFSSESRRSQPGDEQEESSQDLNQAVVDLRLRPEAIRDRLDLVLCPGRYGYRLEPGPEASGTFSMRCHLRVGPGRRTGIGTASSPRVAGQVALASAAEAFGMGASGKIAGPLVADRKSWHRLPDPVLERLEQREEPSPWTPDSGPPGNTGQT